LAEQVTEVFNGRRRNCCAAVHFTGNCAFHESLCNTHRVSFDAILNRKCWGLLLAILLLHAMDDAGPDPVCKGSVFTLAEASAALLAIAFGLALAAEDCFTYPTVRPLSGFDLLFVSLNGHHSLSCMTLL
jgi:hypothetical protein